MLELADEHVQLGVEARCWCGERATHNARLVNGEMTREGETIVIGDTVPSAERAALRRRRHLRAALPGATTAAATSPDPRVHARFRAMEPVMARKMWRTLEPYHGLVYFAPEATEAYEGLGVPGFAGYFASRAAPMGAVAAGVVQATFFNFHPDAVRQGHPRAWDAASPADLLDARLAGSTGRCAAACGDALDSPDVGRAAELTRAATRGMFRGGPAAVRRTRRAALAGRSPTSRSGTASRCCGSSAATATSPASVDAGLDGLDALDLPRRVG